MLATVGPEAVRRLTRVCRDLAESNVEFSDTSACEGVVAAVEAALGPTLLGVADDWDLPREFIFARATEALFPDAAATADDIADRLAISPRALFRAFRRWPGIGPDRYLRLIRLHRLRGSPSSAPIPCSAQ